MAYEIIFDVLVILFASLVLGELFEQVRVPSIAGVLAAGLILGPAVSGVIVYDSQIQAVSTIALFLIIFMVGFEMRAEMLRKHLRPALVLTSTSFFIPLLFAFAAALYFFQFGHIADFVVALSITVPSLPIISVFVIRYGLLESFAGEVILSSVAVSEIVALIVLAIVSQSVPSIIQVTTYAVAAIIIFLLIARLLGQVRNFSDSLLVRVSRITKTEDLGFASLLVVGLLSAWIFQIIGISYVVGAFFAGLVLHEFLIGKQVYSSLVNTLSRMNKALFIPIFFGFAGTQATRPSGDYSALISLAAVVVASIIPAIGLTWLTSRHIAQGDATPKQIALSLGGRGSVGIILATIALEAGLIDQTAFTLIILATLAISISVSLGLGTTTRHSKVGSSAVV